MSIATNSVLRRILDEVRDRPAPGELARSDVSRDTDQLLDVRRTRVVHRPPFATPFHFWAHALRAFLADRGRPDVFDALAVHCLCDPVEPERVGPALEGLTGRMAKLAKMPALRAPADYRAGYRMIDQERLVSWVAECDDEFVAVFWVQPDWLGEAHPVDLDD